MDPVQGSCLCGGVRFEVTEPFIRVSQCHCTFCKGISGGYGTVSGRANTDAIRVLEGRELLTSYTPEGGLLPPISQVWRIVYFVTSWNLAKRLSLGV